MWLLAYWLISQMAGGVTDGLLAGVNGIPAGVTDGILAGVTAWLVKLLA